jgi:hypothetical protein
VVTGTNSTEPHVSDVGDISRLWRNLNGYGLDPTCVLGVSSRFDCNVKQSAIIGTCIFVSSRSRSAAMWYDWSLIISSCLRL